MEIKKLEDVVAWFDNWIEETKLDLTEEDMEDDTTIKEFETIKKVILKSIERHNVYTSALNNDIADKAAKIELLEKEIEGRKEGYVALKTQMDTKYISIDEHNDICKAYESENENLKKQVEYLKKELEETYRTKETDLKNHQKRDMALVDELAKKNDEIKELKESIEEWKNQERIRTNSLRATERKVEELYKRIEGLTRANRIVANIASALTHEEDDYGKSGFKRYIEHLIEEEERAVPERFKERLNKEITEIFTKEEETEVNDIPCGKDSIE